MVSLCASLPSWDCTWDHAHTPETLLVNNSALQERIANRFGQAPVVALVNVRESVFPR